MKAATGRNSYAEHDALVRKFGAKSTRTYERGLYEQGGEPEQAMSRFLEQLHGENS